MKISVLTATYNRANTLSNLYKSLIRNKQFYSNFEWLIMNDGSIDNTEKIIKQWMVKNIIKIRYFKQRNQGKMIAINNLIKHVKGDIIIECDSDDYFTNNCFKVILEKWKTIKTDDKVYGLAFLKTSKNKKTIGNNFKENGKILKVFDMYFKENIIGDKCFVFKSNIRKQFKHKLENNEHFVTEGRMFHKIDLKYKGLKCFNIPIIICTYLDDGYSSNILELFKKYPYGYYHYYLEMFNFNMKGISFKKRLHIIKHYLLFSYLTKKRKIEIIKESKGILNKILVFILIIPGYIVTKIKFR